MEAKTIFNFGDVEPIAYLCNFCEKWSEYKKEYFNNLPRGWRESDKGYQCNDCRKSKGAK